MMMRERSVPESPAWNDLMRPTGAVLGCSGNRSLVSATCTTTRLGLESEKTSNSVVFGKPMTKRVRC